jgi:WD40 repeat protein
MEPILYINQPKVESVLFSPCEKYILLYSPKKDMPYSVWNFMTLEKIREFEQNEGEGPNTFKWSYNGEYIAKQSVKKIK